MRKEYLNYGDKSEPQTVYWKEGEGEGSMRLNTYLHKLKLRFRSFKTTILIFIIWVCYYTGLKSPLPHQYDAIIPDVLSSFLE